MSGTRRAAANCRHALPTLFLAAPDWADATDRPWSCRRGAGVRELESTEVCETCAFWQPIEAAPATFGEPCEHLRTEPFFLDLLTQL
jgi:hypothetical protein